jgi:secondary thiamine-phosphate synthase enzyme
MFTDITDWVSEHIPDGFCGVATIHTPHTTAGLAQLESEILQMVDIRFFLDNIIPKQKPVEGAHRNTKYLHDMISLREGVPPEERINGHSHVRSLLFPSSTAVPIVDGFLQLGDWKRIFFVELDPIRRRKVSLMLTSEAS